MASKRSAGQPTKFKPEYCEQARKLCLLGFIDSQIADFFNVSVSTINNWKREHPEFLESLKAGKVNADANVAVGLYQRATGYTHREDKIFQNNGIPVIVESEKHYPPDPISIKYWLNNRQPELWREKVEKEDSDQDAQPLTINFNVSDPKGEIETTFGTDKKADDKD